MFHPLSYRLTSSLSQPIFSMRLREAICFIPYLAVFIISAYLLQESKGGTKMTFSARRHKLKHRTLDSDDETEHSGKAS